MRLFGREIIYKKRDSVNEKITFSDLWLMFGVCSFDTRDIDSKMMGQPRAIAAIEPIKGNTVFVADTMGGVDG